VELSKVPVSDDPGILLPQFNPLTEADELSKSSIDPKPRDEFSIKAIDLARC